MKKTLIALAAVAVTSTAMAQVTMSGKYAFAYVSTTTAAGVTTTGGETTDGDIVFSASEDLGGGMSISASSALKLRGRGTGTTDGRDASLTLAGGFGKILVGSIEAGNGILGLGGAGAPVIGLDDSAKTLSGAGNIDILRYYTPELAPGLVAYVTSIEAPGAGGHAAAATQVGVSYSAGALKVSADVANYATGAATAAADGACVPAAGTSVTALTSATATCTLGTVVRPYVAATTLATARDQQTRISASYNLGVATVGVGYQTQSFQLAGTPDNKQTVVGLSAPVGNMTVGVLFATQKQGTTVDKSGTEIGVNYALSKRTNLQVANQSYKSGTAASAKTTRVRLMHSF